MNTQNTFIGLGLPHMVQLHVYTSINSCIGRRALGYVRVGVEWDNDPGDWTQRYADQTENSPLYLANETSSKFERWREGCSP